MIPDRMRDAATRLAGAAMLAGAVVAFAWAGLLHWHEAPATAPVAPAPVVAPNATPAAVRVANSTEIMRHRAAELTVFRLAENPAVLVLDFASLHQQGRMLNRVAAMVEKRGLPHDRVLDDAALDRAIHDRGGEPDTFYFGHDYGAASLAAFFAAADRQGVRLTAEEESLRTLLRQERPGALISIPQPDPAHAVDSGTRDVVFQHERAHGAYFTDPAYAAYAARFWTGVLSPAQRAGFRRFLAGEDYDPALEDLMINETQAYLMHTRDRRFFDPAAAGLDQAELDRLRGLFLVGMPPSWLRDCFARDGSLPQGR